MYILRDQWYSICVGLLSTIGQVHLDFSSLCLHHRSPSKTNTGGSYNPLFCETILWLILCLVLLHVKTTLLKGSWNGACNFDQFPKTPFWLFFPIYDINLDPLNHPHPPKKTSICFIRWKFSSFDLKQICFKRDLF